MKNVLFFLFFTIISYGQKYDETIPDSIYFELTGYVITDNFSVEDSMVFEQIIDSFNINIENLAELNYISDEAKTLIEVSRFEYVIMNEKYYKYLFKSRLDSINLFYIKRLTIYSNNMKEYVIIVF